MNIYLDLESLPDQQEGALEQHIQAVSENFKAPSGMTKAEMVRQLEGKGVTYKDNGKFIPAGDVRQDWEDAFRDEMVLPLAEESYRKTALTDEGCICVIGAKADDYIYLGVLGEAGEAALLADFFSWVNQVSGHSQPHFVAHNASWDLERLAHKAWIHNIKPGVAFPFDGRHDKDFYCTMQAWAGYKKYITQDALCDVLGLPGKDGMDGSMVWDTWQLEGGPEAVAAYCARDVETVERIYKRLTFQE